MVWDSSNDNLALVNNPGVGKVTTVTAGSVTISATSSNNKVGTKSVKINHGSVNKVTLPSSTTVTTNGGKRTLTATFKDAKNHVVSGNGSWKITRKTFIFGQPLTTITLTTAGNNKATVTGKNFGNSTVTVTSNGRSATITVSTVPF